MLMVVVVVGALMVSQSPDYGNCWDDSTQALYGNQVYDYLLNTGKPKEVFGEDNTVLNLWMYGGSWEFLTHATKVLDIYDYITIRRVLTVLCSLALLLYILLYSHKSIYVRCLCAILLYTHPVYYGHIYINTKDIPFAVFYTIAIFMMLPLIELKVFPLKTYLLLGLAIGATTSLRIGGILLVCFLGMIMLYRLIMIWFIPSRFNSVNTKPDAENDVFSLHRLFQMIGTRTKQESEDSLTSEQAVLEAQSENLNGENKPAEEESEETNNLSTQSIPPDQPVESITQPVPVETSPPKQPYNYKLALHYTFKDIIGIGVLMFVVWILTIAIWPYCHKYPITGPFYAFDSLNKFPWHGVVLFNGEYTRYPQMKLPYYYVTYHNIIQAPDHIIWMLGLMFILGVVFVHRVWALLMRTAVTNVLQYLFLAFTFCFPVVYVMIKAPPIYDCARHFLFILPTGCFLCAAGFYNLCSIINKYVAWIMISLVSLTMMLTLYDMVSLHPYQYVYYNRTIAVWLTGVCSKI